MPDPTFDKSNGWWYIRWRDTDGKRTKQPLVKDDRWKGPGHKIAKAPPDAVLVARKYQDMETAARHGVSVAKVRPIELEAELDAYRVSFTSENAKSSVKVLNRAIREFLDFAKTKGIVNFGAVDVEHCRLFMEHRKKAGKAYGTIRLEKAVLSPIWSRAKRERRVAENPWKDVKVPGKPSDEKPKFWTVAELEKIIALSSGYLKDLILVGVNCGARIASLLGLKWDDVDWQLGVIRLNSKTGRYQVPMSPVAKNVLERRNFTIHSDYVFPSRISGGAIKSNVTYERMRRLAKRAGVPPKGSYNHILRHTFASHAIMRGIPLATVSKWLGHGSIAMTMRYSHLCETESQRMMDGFSLGGEDQPPKGG